MNPRRQKGLEIAARYTLRRKGRVWIVPSQSGKQPYRVTLDGEAPACTCPDHEVNRAKCKHIFAAEFVSQRQQKAKKKESPEPAPDRPKRPTYKQEWPAYNAAQTTEKHYFQLFLYDLCETIDDPLQTMGRPRHVLSDMIFCSGMKVYTMLSSRRLITDLAAAHEKGYISDVPHFNSVLNYLDAKILTPLLHDLITRSSLPLKSIEQDFTVDSSGFSTSKYVSWFNTRYGHEQDNKDWIKLHLTAGSLSHIVTAAIVTGRHAHDSPHFKPMVKKTARNFKLRDVSADKAYSSKGNLKLVKKLGGTAYVPFKKDATGEGGGLWEKMFHYYNLHREEFLSHYHRRSNAESTFNMIKAKFGGFVRGKTDTAQVNEALMKVIAHNICVLIQSMYELEIDPAFQDRKEPRSNPSRT